MVNLILGNRFPSALFIFHSFVLLFLFVIHNCFLGFLRFPKYLWNFHENVSYEVPIRNTHRKAHHIKRDGSLSLPSPLKILLCYFCYLFYLSLLISLILPWVRTFFSVHTTGHLQYIQRSKHRRWYLPSEAAQSHGYWSRPRYTTHLPLPE